MKKSGYLLFSNMKNALLIFILCSFVWPVMAQTNRTIRENTPSVNGNTWVTDDDTFANRSEDAVPTSESVYEFVVAQIASGALTATQVKTLYESNADTNEFSDALLAKLNAIAAGAEVNLTGAETVTLLDAYFGNTDWRTGGGGVGSNPVNDLAGGTVLTAGNDYFDTASANRTLTISGTSGTISVYLQVTATPVTWNITELVGRSGTDGTTNEITFDKEWSEFHLKYVDGTWRLADTGTGAASGGSSVSVDGASVADPDFVSSGDIDFVNTAGDVSANINAGVVGSAELASSGVSAGTYTSITSLTVDVDGRVTAIAGTVQDLTAPVLSGASGSQTGDTSASWNVTSDEAGGTIFAAARLSASSVLTVANIENGTGDAVATSTDATPTADGTNAGSFTGLTQSTEYVVDIFQRDAAGNESAVVSSAAFSTTGPIAATSPGTANLLAWYSHDDASGGLVDAHSTSNDLTENGTPLYAQTGVIGTAIEYDGSTDYFSRAGRIGWNQAYPFTLAGHFSSTTSANQVIAQWTEPGSFNNYVNLMIKNDGEVQVTIRDSDIVNTTSSGESVLDGSFHHLAAVCVSSTERYIYLDGVLIVGGSGLPAASLDNGISEFRIGVDESGDIHSYFDGLLDDVCAFGQALTIGEVNFIKDNTYADL